MWKSIHCFLMGTSALLEIKGLNQVHNRLKPNLKITLPTPTQWGEILLERAIYFYVPAIKLIYSEKANCFCKIFTLLLSYIVPVKSKFHKILWPSQNIWTLQFIRWKIDWPARKLGVSKMTMSAISENPQTLWIVTFVIHH